jgi:excinuclease ABC subunit A
MRMMRSVADRYGFRLNQPFKDLTDEQKDILLNGSGEERILFRVRNGKGNRLRFRKTWEGIASWMKRRYVETSSEESREWYQQFLSRTPCQACGGKRLRPESLAVTISGRSIADVSEMAVTKALRFFTRLRLGERERLISRQVLKEIVDRIGFLENVGVGYLSLNRATGTLSGGEAERIQLATQIGSSLVGVLYILDEPSIGLHQRDNRKLIDTLQGLRDLGNTVLVVEHDEQMMRAADIIVDLGPGAGAMGGQVVCVGNPEEVARDPSSLTGQYLSGTRFIQVPDRRRTGNGEELVVLGARENNLRNLTVAIPLGKLTCVTGVSGSGKSTLVDEILHKALTRRFYGARDRPGEHDGIEGLENVDKAIIIDQSPIGRTPRSNPVTYTGVFTPIRELFSKLPESRVRGYKPGRFSFNVARGRCEACRGDGIIKLEMHFLPDVYVPCEECRGRRYNRETLEIKFKGKNIHDVLEMTLEEAHRFFKNIPRIERKLKMLRDVGLGYVKVGQPATTLSGGEAQRVKLASELGKIGTGRTLYILDEPTTGLHFADIQKLLDVLGRLVDAGNTVLVIEHNLDVIKVADHVIDLGPEGGDKGGRIVAQGTPEEIASRKSSYTGQFLAARLPPHP